MGNRGVFMVKKIGWGIGAILFLAASAYGQAVPKRIPVDLVWAEGPFAVAVEDRPAVVAEANRLLKALPTRVEFKQRVLPASNCNQFLDAEGSYNVDAVGCFRSLPRKKNRLTVYVTPPLITDDGRLGVAGVALTICTGRAEEFHFDTFEFNNLALVYGASRNSVGVDRRPHTAAALAHEVGHLLGAGHTDLGNQKSLMHPAALAFVPAVRFFRNSIRDIGQCLSSPGWGVAPDVLITEPVRF
jgi:hypothetical protein